MDKEKEIAAMTAEIQYAMDVVQGKNKTTIAAAALAWYLVERKDYHKADEVRKETAIGILQGIYELCKEKKQIEFDDVFYWVMKYGVEVDG